MFCYHSLFGDQFLQGVVVKIITLNIRGVAIKNIWGLDFGVELKLIVFFYSFRLL